MRVARITTKVNQTKCTITDIYAGIYIYTYIVHNAITQSRKVKQTLPMSQGYGPAKYTKCKIDIAIPKECGLCKEQEK